MAKIYTKYVIKEKPLQPPTHRGHQPHTQSTPYNPEIYRQFHITYYELEVHYFGIKFTSLSLNRFTKDFDNFEAHLPLPLRTTRGHNHDMYNAGLKKMISLVSKNSCT